MLAQTWTKWSYASGSNVFGTLGNTSVQYTGQFFDVDYSSTDGVGYWDNTNGPYSQNGIAAPTNPGLIRFILGGSGSFVFELPVVDPFIALSSVGNPQLPVVYDFLTSPFTVVSDNYSPRAAYWGAGTYATQGNTLTGQEFSGILKFSGTYTRIDFTFTEEGWHGITVGARSTGERSFLSTLIDADVPADKRNVNDDPDNDGIPNLVEYALGLPPMTAQTNGLPVAGSSSENLTLTYHPCASDVTYMVQTASTLTPPIPWTAAGVSQGTRNSAGDITASIPIGSGPIFLRLVITLNQ